MIEAIVRQRLPRPETTSSTEYPGTAGSSPGVGIAAVLALASMAAVVPLVVVPQSLDDTVMPRLAGSVAITGLALVLLGLGRSTAAPLAIGRRRPLTAALCLFAATAALSTALGVDPRGSVLGEYQRYQGLLPLGAYLVLAAATTIAVARYGSARAIAWGLWAGVVLSAGYALVNTFDLDWIDWTSRGRRWREGGLFGQPNVLAVHLLTAGIASYGLLHAPGRWRRMLVAGGFCLAVAALALSYSRGGWVGAAVGIAGALALSGDWRALRTWRIVPAGAAGLVLVIVAGGPGVIGTIADRTTSIANLGQQSTRLALWGNAMEMVQDRPLLGAGPDGFSVLFPRYRAPDQPGLLSRNVRPESSHGFLFDHLAGLGVAGTATLVGLVGLASAMAMDDLRRQRDPWERALRAGLLGGVAGYFVASFFSYAEAATAWLPWLLLGTLTGLALRTPAPTTGAHHPWVGKVGRACAVSMGAVLLLTGAWLAIADVTAGAASDSAARGDYRAAVDYGRIATRINPLSPRYLEELARHEASLAAARGDPLWWRRAAQHIGEANRRFAPTAVNLVNEAIALMAAYPNGSANGRARELLRQAEDLDPYNEPVREGIANLRQRLGPE